MFDIVTLTLVHTLISIAALLAGMLAIGALFIRGAPEGWTTWFLVLAALTSLTGFLFPFQGVTPAFAVGVVALMVITMMLIARFSFHLAGIWRLVYVGGMVANVWFLAFVSVVQVFRHVPAVEAYAPTQAEPPFLISQVALLAVFIVIGVAAALRFRPGRAAIPQV